MGAKSVLIKDWANCSSVFRCSSFMSAPGRLHSVANKGFPAIVPARPVMVILCSAVPEGAGSRHRVP